MIDALELVIANDLAELGRLAEAVDDFVGRHGLPMEVGFKLNLCFDELITKTVSYGYPDGGRHEIRVRLTLEETELQAELVDDAAPFDPFAERPAPDLDADVDERAIGGLGIFLVTRSVDRASYRREGDRNVVRLIKAIPPTPAAPGALQ